MISFAKKILTTGRNTTAQPLGSDARVRKYSLTSAHESLAPVSGTSFTLNPEHLFTSTHSLSWGRGEDGVQRTGGFAPNRDAVDGDSAVAITWSNVDASSGLNHTEVPSGHPIGLESPREVDTSGTVHPNENLTHTITARISPYSESQGSLRQEIEFQSSVGKTNERRSSNEKISESQTQVETSSGNSLSSIADNVLDSASTFSDVPANSTSSLNILEASTKFQQRARRKLRLRELRPRRKTLDVFYTAGESSNKTSWSHSKSSTPSPMIPEANHADPRLKRSMSGSSGARRHTTGGLDVVASPVDEVLGIPSSFLNRPWPVVYSSSDDLVSDVSRVGQRGKGAVSVEGVRRGSGLRRSSLCATAICVSEMKRCQVIADLDLLEEDTEFEELMQRSFRSLLRGAPSRATAEKKGLEQVPCAVPFENTVVLWPAAVDKPSCFESSRFFRSWITSLESTGFIGSECLLMTPVTLSQGLHEHTLLLFLFPRHLLFAEQKSHSLLKLDQKLSAGDIWLSTRKEDVAELMEVDSTLDGSRSFVLGWPSTTNTVVTFCTSEEKNVWVARIEELIEVENAKDKDPDQQLTIKVVHKERGHTRSRELSVGKSENSFRVLQRCLLDFHLEASSSKDFQLFVRWGKDQPLQPLLGHESPFLFESWFQTFAPRKENSHSYCFILRERKRSKLGSRDTINNQRRMTKVPLRTLFKKSQSRNSKSGPSLFESNLSDLCVDGNIPGRIQTLLRFLYEHGPATDGVFRKPGGHKEVSDFKQHVISAAEDEVNFDDVSVHVVAAVVKEWLRRLPDCLLSSDLYLQWMEVSKISDSDLLHEELRRLSSALPSSHLLVLHHLMCVLHRIQLHSKQNRMTPFNLAVCIAPNILRPPPSASIDLQLTSVAIANAVVARMIDAIEPVLGADCVELYSDVADPRVIQEFEVDGSYEQNRSLDLSFAPNSTAQSLESLDSLPDIISPPIVVTTSSSTHQTLESMSPDSGLTASNPQLYDEDPPTSSTTHSEGHLYLKRARRSREKSESESQTAFDSDTSSQASEERSTGGTVPLRMHGARNVRERVCRLRAMRVNLEELASSFDEQFSFSDDRSDSVVVATTEDLRSDCDDEEKSVEKLEERRSLDKDDKVKVSSFGEDGENVFENVRCVKVVPLLESAEQKVALFTKDEVLLRSPVELSESKPSQSRPNSIEIVTSKVVSTKVDVSGVSTVSSKQERPTSSSSSVVKNRVEKMEGKHPKNDSHPLVTAITPNHTVESETGNNSGMDALPNPPPPATSLPPVTSTLKDIRGSLPCLPQASGKVERSGSTRKGPGEFRTLPVKPEQLVQETQSRDENAFESNVTSKQMNCTNFRDIAFESKVTSKQIDSSNSIKPSHVTTDPRKPTKQIDSCELERVKERALSSESAVVVGKITSVAANNFLDRPQSTVIVHSSPKRKNIASIELTDDDDDGKSRPGIMANPPERFSAPLSQNNLSDPHRKSFVVCVDDGAITARSNDQRRDDVYVKAGMYNRIGEAAQWGDEKHRQRNGRGKLHVAEIRLKDQPRDERRLKLQPRDSRLKDQPQDVRLKFQSRDSWLKDQPRDDGQQKLQSKDSRLKDQPRDVRLKFQSRDIDDNWRLERNLNRAPASIVNSESAERGTSATGVVTTAYVRHITSEGCQATMGTPARRQTPRFLPQNGESPQNREPVRHADHRFPARRRVTVIQLCDDEDAVIVQKNVKRT